MSYTTVTNLIGDMNWNQVVSCERCSVLAPPKEQVWKPCNQRELQEGDRILSLPPCFGFKVAANVPRDRGLRVRGNIKSGHSN
eukprot:2586769-Amphidinium_carterae.2